MDVEIAVSGARYKGKVLRSWPQLPPEAIRLIATFYLHVGSSTSPLPSTWVDQRHHLVYSVVRGTCEMEGLMNVCRPWGLAIETHNFWNAAIPLFDPYGHYGWRIAQQPPFHSRPSIRVSPYAHFRYLLSSSCLACCIKAPCPGLGKRSVYMLRMGVVSLCEEHSTRKCCGVCLRGDSPYGDDTVVKNKDEVVFPAVRATCRACRAEWLWRSALLASDPVPVGIGLVDAEMGNELLGSLGCTAPARFTPSDPIASAGGCVQTRWTELMHQALAAQLCGDEYEKCAEGTGYGGDNGDCDSELEEEDDAAAALEVDVKDLALGDWARARILNGMWAAPADLRYGDDQDRVPLSSEDEPVNHPRRYVDPLPPPPPTKSLEVAAQNAHMRQMRAILLPALHNVVRRVVFDCALDADEVETALDRTRAGCVRNPLDPAMRAVRMSLAEVVCNLREQDVWFDGTD
ncbi:hypothetical protein B0H11DRAFT_2273732 [Mycena galericulata]|nr:hypothetical protein B0H11DRAFT_2273732 [Mycena galericulata]